MSFQNMYQALMQVWEVAKSNSANIFGCEIGIVTNVKDPDKAGRVKVCFPRLPGKPESDWARVGQPAAGPGRGFYWLPQVNDEVLVMFERGQSNAPYVIGSLWNGKDKPMKDAYADENSTIMIQTKSGHQLLIDDKKDQEKIVIGDKSGKRTLTFDVKNKKFLIEAKEGDLEIHAEKKIVLQCEDLEIKSSKSIKWDFGTTFDLKIAQKGGFKAGPQMNIKSGKVNLNPPSIVEIVLEALGLTPEQAKAVEEAAKAAEKAAEDAAAGGAAGGAAGAAGAGGAAGGGAAGASAGTVPTQDASPDAAGKAGSGGVEGADWTKDKAGAAGGAAGDAAKTEATKGADDAAKGAEDKAKGDSGDLSKDGGDGKAAGDKGATGDKGADGSKAADKPADAKPGPTDVAATLQDAQGNPVPNVKWKVTLPDGTEKTGTTGDDGKVSVTGLSQSGDYKLDLPDVDKSASAPATTTTAKPADS